MHMVHEHFTYQKLLTNIIPDFYLVDALIRWPLIVLVEQLLEYCD